MTKQQQQSYITEFKQKLSDSVFTDIPNPLEENVESFKFHSPYVINAIGYCGFYFKVKYSQTDFHTIVDVLNTKAIYSSYIDDDNNYFLGKDFNRNFISGDYDSSHSPPLPTLGLMELSFINIRIHDSIKIVVLNHDSGIFFNNSIPIKPNTRPAGLNNGFSNGVLIDEEGFNIYYWILVW